jgi:hypothetical protein
VRNAGISGAAFAQLQRRFHSRKLMDPAQTTARVSISALAAALGVTEAAIRYRVQRGQLSPPDAKATFDLERALREWAATTPPGPKRGRKPGKSKLAPLERAAGQEKNPDYRWRLARARREELLVRQMGRKLVDREEVRDAEFKTARAVRDAVQNWPARIAAELAAKHGVTNALAFLADLEAAVRMLLAELAASLGSKPV